MTLVYKILPRGEWDAALVAGVFEGSEVDRRDGFIHLSGEDQWRETLRRHFADQPSLVRVGLRPEDLGTALKWEPSRGGELFPHLYGPLDPALAVSTKPVVR